MNALDSPTTQGNPMTDDRDLTIYEELEQRSPEWYAVRCGLVTASTVGRLLTVAAPGADAYECPECAAPAYEPCISLRGGAAIKTMHSGRATVAAENAATADPVIRIAKNDTSRGLIATLATERITNHVEDTPISSDMWRGIVAEPVARMHYEAHHGAVKEIGFMVRRFPGGIDLGWSPDGLVGDDGAIEIKAPRGKGHVTDTLADEVPAHHMAQCQAALLVSGREWIDFVSFHGGLPLWVKRVTPERAWHDAIRAAVEDAEYDIGQMVHRYRKATKGLPGTERIQEDADVELTL